MSMFTLGRGGPLGHELRERVGEVIYLEGHGWFLSAPRVISYRASMRQLAARVAHGDHPHLAGVAVLELPGSGGQGGALALDDVHVAAHLLDGRDAGAQDGPPGDVPLGMLFLGIEAGRLDVLAGEALHLRAAAMVGHGGGQRMVDERGVDGHHLGLHRHEPLGRFLGETRGFAVVLESIGVLVMPAGDDDHDVALFDARLGVLEVGGGDDFPGLLGNVEDAAVAEEAVGGDGRQVGALLDEVEGSVHVGAGVHDGDDAPGEDAVLGVLDRAVHLDVGLPGIGRSPVAPDVAQFDQLKPADGINGDVRHASLPLGMSG